MLNASATAFSAALCRLEHCCIRYFLNQRVLINTLSNPPALGAFGALEHLSFMNRYESMRAPTSWYPTDQWFWWLGRYVPVGITVWNEITISGFRQTCIPLLTTIKSFPLTTKEYIGPKSFLFIYIPSREMNQLLPGVVGDCWKTVCLARINSYNLVAAAFVKIFLGLAWWFYWSAQPRKLLLIGYCTRPVVLIPCQPIH